VSHVPGKGDSLASTILKKCRQSFSITTTNNKKDTWKEWESKPRKRAP